jgi:AcrR family transcriptional regulator
MSTGDDKAKARRKNGPRERNAAATQNAILEAARAAFTRAGYDGVGLREIAAAAGVDVALIGRYFKSKEGLFAQAVPPTFEVGPLLAGDREGFGERLARYVLSKPKDPVFDPTTAMLRAAPNAAAAQLISAGLEERFVAPLAAWLGGRDARARAAMIMATLAGVAALRDVVKVPSLLPEDRRALQRLLTESLQACVEPGRAGASRPSRATRAQRR